ncbi:MAG: hypothetical protein WB812_17890, partial [Woeseiaceae bacterium]
MPYVVVLLVLAGPPGIVAASEAPSYYDRHVIFDNSSAGDAFDRSRGSVVEPSSLDLIEGMLPVAVERFTSPPNALRLSWRSAFGGDWQASIRVGRHYARPFHFEGDALSLRVMADTQITAANSPRLYLTDRNGHGTPAVTLVSGDNRIAAGEWTTVTLRFADILDEPVKNTRDNEFTIAEVASVNFTQG